MEINSIERDMKFLTTAENAGLAHNILIIKQLKSGSWRESKNFYKNFDVQSVEGRNERWVTEFSPEQINLISRKCN